MSRIEPLFVDTNAFVALANEDDAHHEAAREVQEAIRTGELSYGPLFTSRYVISETATAILYGVGHREAVAVLKSIRDSQSINVVDVTEELFRRTETQFEDDEDQQISFIDHLNSVIGDEFGIEHIFAFEEDFATLGMIRVPVDTGGS